MKRPTGILRNTETGRFHPIPFRLAPSPSDHATNPEYQRHKSYGHHTEGFDSLEAAKQWIAEQENLSYVDMMWKWDGKDLPAMTQRFKVEPE
ncbi:hypothetical protein HON36_00570 [Candidatus Parcubacteria bacterium]|jgi:hypothetical protein|nr:hypothetical protein [Candidatus Parcubacteria bacterium]MBT7228625.1 hypothetical protein [Candidatus Parcubacteria bacterium]